MRIILSLFVVASSVSGVVSPSPFARIVGGSPSYISSYPWQVSVQRRGAHICGGVIYSANIIITAAHCLLDVPPGELQVRAGSTYWNRDGQLHKVARYRCHDRFVARSMENDIALLLLASPLTFNFVTRSIGLAMRTPANGLPASTSGWGSRSYGEGMLPFNLEGADVQIIGWKQCRSIDYDYGAMILPTMICAGLNGKGTCVGDYGGPLVVEGYLAGIASWSYGCGFNRSPGVFTSIADFTSWIADTAMELTYGRRFIIR